MARLMLVDDEADIRLLFRVFLDASGHEVVCEAEDGSLALTWFDLHPDEVDVVILDYRMPGLTGIDTAREILSRRPDQRVVLCSACLDPRVRSEAKELGVYCYDKREWESLVDALAA